VIPVDGHLFIKRKKIIINFINQILKNLNNKVYQNIPLKLLALTQLAANYV